MVIGSHSYSHRVAIMYGYNLQYTHVSVILILNDLVILYIPTDVATININIYIIKFHNFQGTRRKIPGHVAPCSEPKPTFTAKCPQTCFREYSHKEVSGKCPEAPFRAYSHKSSVIGKGAMLQAPYCITNRMHSSILIKESSFPNG